MIKDITPRNNKNQKHYRWIIHHPNGDVWHKGQYLNGIEVGYSIWYVDSSLTEKTYYIR